MIPHEIILPISIFLAISLAVWGALSMLANRTVTSEDRLQRVMLRAAGRPASGQLMKESQLQEKIASVATRLAKPMEPKNEQEVGKIRLLLLGAGYRHPQALQIFLGLKFGCLLLCLGIVVPTVVPRLGLGTNGLLAIVGAAAVGLYLPNIIVGSQRKSRQEAIFLGLPDALDLMVVCVEAGLGFDAAMRRVTSELAESCPVLCDEFNIAAFQIQMGRPRREALRELGMRTGVEDVRALAAVIIQAEKFGSSIGAALRVQSDSMRTKRRQLAEERAAKTAVKIMIPLIMFIFPGVFVVLVGPAGMQIAKMFSK